MLVPCTRYHAVLYNYTFRSASDMNDYSVISSTQLTFTSGQTSNGDEVCIDIEIIDDDDYEGDHQLTVELESVSPSSAAVVSSPNTSVIMIRDNSGEY